MLLAVLTFFLAIVIFTIFAGAGPNASLSKEFPWQFRMAAALRTPVLMFIVIPLSYIQGLRRTYRTWSGARARAALGEAAIMAKHDANVQAIVAKLTAWNKAGRPGKLRTARPSWASMSTKLGSGKDVDTYKIEIRQMNSILQIDWEGLTVTAEPSVTMGELTHALMPHGLALQTHVEMESITIGGVACGFGIETNSHKVGLFQESVLAYEMVDANGKVHHVTKDSDPELFYAIPWSCGTAGFLVSIKVRLVRTKPFVRVRYEPTSSPEQLTARMTELSKMGDKAPVFLEATMYSRTEAVIQCGYYADPPTTAEERGLVNRINDFWKPFYFRHVETFLAKGETEELVPLKHFLHRFTRSIFWELEDMIPFSNHVLYRCLWGWLGAPEVSLLKLFQGPVIRKASCYAHVVQESIMPLHRLTEGIDKFDEWFGVYPLLVFPVRIYDRKELSGFLRPNPKELEKGQDYGTWVDLGAYGVPQKIKDGGTWDAKHSIREMEHWTRDNDGWCAVYTDIFCTQTEFRQMFDHTLIDKCRARLKCAGAFPEVYAKVKPEAGIADLSAEIAAEAAGGKGGKAAGAKSPARAGKSPVRAGKSPTRATPKKATPKK